MIKLTSSQNDVTEEGAAALSESSTSSSSSSACEAGGSPTEVIEIMDEGLASAAGSIQEDKAALKIEQYDALFGVTVEEIAAIAAPKSKGQKRAGGVPEMRAKKARVFALVASAPQKKMP